MKKIILVVLIVIAIVGYVVMNNAKKSANVTVLKDIQSEVDYKVNLFEASTTSTLTLKEGGLPLGIMLKYESVELPCAPQVKVCPKQDWFVASGKTSALGKYNFSLSLNGAEPKSFSVEVKK